MIDQAILLLKSELKSYIDSKGDTSVDVSIDNIGLLETSKTDSLENRIVITLVNIEEESTLKNQSAQRRPFGATAIYQNPPVYLNLYILFTCNYSGVNYVDALKRLSHIVRFVQSKNSFAASSSVAIGDVDLANDDIAELRFTLELYTLTFEQINHLWGSLGGRQVPFAMYKLRLVGITEKAILREVPLIIEVETIQKAIVIAE